MQKTMIQALSNHLGKEVVLKGWVHRLRVLSKITFVIVQDCTGSVQCVGATCLFKDIKLEDVIEIKGLVRAEDRSRVGFEVDILEFKILNEASHTLPFHSSSETPFLEAVGQDVLLQYRPLALRHERVGSIFRLQAALVESFRKYLRSQRFTEIFTSKIVSAGTEGGTHLFEIKYFDRAAYLAQSPQFFKEQGVLGLERVFETGHVYRAEPHATTRHLTEYYSLDLEFGFIDGPEDVMELERALLSSIFDELNSSFGTILKQFGQNSLPSMMKVPAWEFSECLERLKHKYQRNDLVDDLDPLAERQLCELAFQETGIGSVFVVGFPLTGRPFYTHPRGQGRAQSFDLLFGGLEITTGGQRLHTRKQLEEALKARGMLPAAFEAHLNMFDLGMPPHGGLAIGAERLTAQILGLPNVRQATLYPRDRMHIEP